MIVLIPHLVVIFFLKLNKPIKLLQELLAMIFTRSCVSAPVSACQCPGCRQQWWWVQYIPPARPQELASYLPPPHQSGQPGHRRSSYTRNKVVFFNRPGMVQMLLVVGGVWCRVCWPARAWRPWRLWRRTSWRTCPPGWPAPAPAGGGSSTPRPGTGGGELIVIRAWNKGYPKVPETFTITESRHEISLPTQLS